MKQYRKYRIFGWLSVLTLMLTTACVSNDVLDVTQTGKRTVTITVQTESQTGSMRSANLPRISDGSKVDALIYAVYQKQTDGSYKTVTDIVPLKTDVTDFVLGENQGSVLFTPGKSVTFQLTMEERDTYRLAFWAQKKDCKAYNTTDLQNVKVLYDKKETTDTLNNNELRDAFCGYADVSGTDDNVKVTLYRPFAQVNVGTTGWDYEGAAALKPSAVSYIESRVTFGGVAQYYNVLGGSDKKGRGQAIVTDEKPVTTASFGFNRLPAFVNIWDTIPGGRPHYQKYDNEEMLVVDLDQKDGIKPYISWKQYDDSLYTKNIRYSIDSTETFKYLSMSYILVPEAFSGQPLPDSVTTSAVLDSITFIAQGIPVEKGETISPSDLEKTFTIKNVPVQKNWRTNILSDNFFTTSGAVYIDIVKDYCGDYNYDGNEWGDPSEGNSWPRVDGEIHEVWFNLPSCDSSDGYGKEDSFFKYEGAHNHSDKYFGTYKGQQNCKNGLKLEGAYGSAQASVIKFTTKSLSTVTIVQFKKSSKEGDAWTEGATFTFDGKEQPQSSAVTTEGENVLVYTLTNVSAGEHRITTSTSEANKYTGDNSGRYKQPGILYIEVVSQEDIHPDTENKNDDFDGEHDDDNYYED